MSILHITSTESCLVMSWLLGERLQGSTGESLCWKKNMKIHLVKNPVELLWGRVHKLLK